MRFDLLTFDCYGTLIDWEAGILNAFRGAMSASGDQLDREAVLGLHSEIEPAIQAEGYRTYREVLTETARQMAERLNLEFPTQRQDFLAESIREWKPFDDTADALRILQASGLDLGILSNIDDDLLAGTLPHLEVEFEFLVTAQQVHSYKPAPGHFTEARQRVGDRRWLHVAQSQFHDIRPCGELEIPAVWINRKGEERAHDLGPLAEFPDLQQFADWMVGRSPSEEPA